MSSAAAQWEASFLLPPSPDPLLHKLLLIEVPKTSWIWGFAGSQHRRLPTKSNDDPGKAKLCELFRKLCLEKKECRTDNVAVYKHLRDLQKAAGVRLRHAELCEAWFKASGFVLLPQWKQAPDHKCLNVPSVAITTWEWDVSRGR